MLSKPRLATISFLLMLTAIAVLGPGLLPDAQAIQFDRGDTASSAGAEKVHALLILLGDDSKIQASVKKNEGTMKRVLMAVSEHCDVQMTVMKSEDTLTGTVTELTLFDKKIKTRKSLERQSHGIIEPKEVSAWLQNLKSNPEDIILIYYSGHGGIDDFDTHFLSFSSVDTVPVSRDKIRDRLVAKPGRLKLLITDTCSDNVDIPPDAIVDFAIGVAGRIQYHTEDLFLRHTGLLDITAAAPGERAWGNSEIGGYFTHSLSASLTHATGKNSDSFLSWEKVFEATHQKTRERFSEAWSGGTLGAFSPNDKRKMQDDGQATQTPTVHKLPKRLNEAPAIATDLREIRDFPKDSIVYNLGRKVAFLIHKNHPVSFTTGFLVGPDLLLTTSGIKRDPYLFQDFSVCMNYYEDGMIGGLSASVKQVLKINYQLGYALLQLDKPIGETYGWLNINTATPSQGTDVMIIHHSRARSKKISRLNNTIMHVFPDNIHYQTEWRVEAGSVGSPVFIVNDNSVIAMHSRRLQPSKFGMGVLMKKIYPEIELFISKSFGNFR